LRRRLAEALNTHAPGLSHELRRMRGQLDPESSLTSLLCDVRRAAVCVGAGDEGWMREIARRSSSVVVFEHDRARWPHLRRLASDRLRLESAVLCDHDGRLRRRSPDGADLAVELRSLDSYKISGVGLIRIEAGALARSVLGGASATLKVDRPYVLVAGGAELGGLVSWLSTQGFAPVAADEIRAGGLHFPR